MVTFTASDDPRLGAPYALCALSDAFRSLAPASCTAVVGSVPPQFSFHRSDYHWLAISLASCEQLGPGDHALDHVFYGMHVLRWEAMHSIVATAIAAGFDVVAPSDIVAAVKAALTWSIAAGSSLRVLTEADFEPLPPFAPVVADAWWLSTAYSAWITDSALHALSHAIGFAGPVWTPASRDVDSRFHLSLLLTQEFCTVSPALPSRLYGDPAVRFYSSSMPPPPFLVFPGGIARLHSALTTRWGYLHGNVAQVSNALGTILPSAIKEFPGLARFLVPVASAPSQVSAYRVISELLAPTMAWHRYETMRLLDQRLMPYLHIVEQADLLQPPALAETRASALQDLLERERRVVVAAPADGSFSRDGTEGPATSTVLQALFDLGNHQLIRDLERDLMQVWTPSERYPAEVFRITLASRSLTCVSILFSGLSGVRDAGPIYSILESASQERQYYFSVRLSVPAGEVTRPDHTRWFTYPLSIDKAVRSPDFATFAKINLFELGAQIRQLKEEVIVCPQDSPPAGTEFNAEHFMYHLSLLSHISSWVQALGFALEGKAAFVSAFRALSSFCENGAHYRGTVLDSHVNNMRRLYRSMQQDLHESFHVFRPQRLSSFNQFIIVDAMFTQEGNFYSTLRLFKDDISHLNRLARLGVIDSPSNPLSAEPDRKRIRLSSLPAAHLPPSRVLSPPTHPAASTSYAMAVYEPLPTPILGSFAWAIKEDEHFIKVLGFKYAKAPILDRLRLAENQICLASYLSKKGVAACPCPTRSGHESFDSPLHVFSEAVLAMRPSFEEPPYRIRGDGGQQSLRSNRGRGSRRQPGRGRAGRQVSAQR